MRQKHVLVLVGILALGIVVGLAGTVGIFGWRLRHETLAVRALLRTPSCTPVIQAAIATADDILRQRIDHYGIADYRVSNVRSCVIEVDLPKRSHLDSLVHSLSRIGDLELIGMGNLPILKPGTQFQKAVQSQCSSSKSLVPCLLVSRAEIDRSSLSVSQDQLGEWQLAMSTIGNAIDRTYEYTALHRFDSIAIVVDGKVVADPTINMPVPGGLVVVPGLSSEEEARTLQVLIHDPLPLRLDVVSLQPLLGTK